MATSEESSSATPSSSEASEEVGVDTLQTAVTDLVSSCDLESISLRELRRLLEKKLQLPDLALDKQRKAIKDMVGEAITKAEQERDDKVMKAEVAVKRERNESPPKVSTRKRVKKNEKSEDDESSSSPSNTSSASSDASSDDAREAAAPKRKSTRSRTPPPEWVN
ncbi:conserved hypothetical protein [Perkinsus marinus ATCC 50983]|uniref:DEK-C domain-containing protein n=1 Tax=Perkinsus marinus (strain ATCC 50983 / TXsc) TaxID=423536 RepID=C5KMH1_PERM5|nr:conserved hypothetical protein [Perkinsus marinus ATCC 50983]EER14322.1 conserved hypothetical protein [Perkinsus marinus ATCC 50983]|eukprot:XP_002782527.1 conserved hypothetical protein [Perkinsus marinus ATCC 50983]